MNDKKETRLQRFYEPAIGTTDQQSLKNQLIELQRVAGIMGLYDAADFLQCIVKTK